MLYLRRLQLVHIGCIFMNVCIQISEMLDTVWRRVFIVQSNLETKNRGLSNPPSSPLAPPSIDYQYLFVLDR